MFANKKKYTLTKETVSAESAETISIIQKDDWPTNNSKAPVRHNPFLGIFYTFLTSLNISLTSVMVKKLFYIDPGQASLVRNAGVFAFTLPVAVYSVRDVFGAKKDRRLLIMRGFLGSTALYLSLTAYKYLPLAEAAVIMSTSPALTTVVAHFSLKESCGRVQIISLVVSILGVLTSVRLPELLSQRGATRFDYYYVAGLAAAVGSVLAISFTLVALRKMKDMHFSVPMLYFGFIGMVENASINAVSSSFANPTCGWDRVAYSMIAMMGFLANYTFTLSTQVESAGIVSVLRCSMDIVVVIVFQILFFSETPDVYNIVGACLVLVAVGTLGVRNWLLILPEESKARRKLKYFLT